APLSAFFAMPPAPRLPVLAFLSYETKLAQLDGHWVLQGGQKVCEPGPDAGGEYECTVPPKTVAASLEVSRMEAKGVDEKDTAIKDLTAKVATLEEQLRTRDGEIVIWGSELR